MCFDVEKCKKVEQLFSSVYLLIVFGAKNNVRISIISDTRGRKVVAAPDRPYSEIRLCKNVNSRYNVWAVVTRFVRNAHFMKGRFCN